MMHDLLVIWFGWVEQWGCLGVVILMALESTIIPVPSEVVVPPAMFLAAKGDLTLWGGNSPAAGFWAVVWAGTIGSYVGSAISYGVARWLGRPIIIRWGKYFLVPEKKLAMAEVWLARYEAGGIFFARLLPVIRHLISIPAGIIRMKFWMFSLMTSVGAFIWCVVLAWLGQKAYKMEPELINDPAKMVSFMKAQSHWIVIGIVALMVLYFLVLRLTAPKKDQVA